MSSGNNTLIAETFNKGRAVYANRNFTANEIVIVGKKVYKSSERTWQTLQLDIDIHVRLDEPFEVVNHSCNPNCGLKSNSFDGYNLVAMRPIQKGEEITFDYCMSEWISIAVSKCECQSSTCRKSIQGGKFLSAQTLEKYEGFLAPYYKKLLQGK